MAETRQEHHLPPEQVAAVLRERIYGGINCLSTLLVLVRHPDDGSTPWGTLLDVAVTTGGLWAASLLADYVAHLAAHGQKPTGAEVVEILRASGQILQGSFLPLVLLVLAGLGVLGLPVALRAGVVVLVVELGLFALLAARRTGLSWWQRAVIVAALTGLGALVVLLKTVAH